MEKSADTIGKKEFDDVWTRVSGGDTGEEGADTVTKADTAVKAVEYVTGNETKPKTPGALTQSDGSLGGLVSNVLSRRSSATESGTPATTRSAAAAPRATRSASDVASSAGERLIGNEAERLLSIMEAMAQTKRECAIVASQSKGETRRTCQAMEQACRNSIKDLNAQYYILTGLRCCPGSTITQVASTTDRLAEIVDTQDAVNNVCAEAAEETAIASLQNAYTRCANCSERIGRAADQLLWNINRN